MTVGVMYYTGTRIHTEICELAEKNPFSLYIHKAIKTTGFV
jgi:hypothetical protein